MLHSCVRWVSHRFSVFHAQLFKLFCFSLSSSLFSPSTIVALCFPSSSLMISIMFFLSRTVLLRYDFFSLALLFVAKMIGFPFLFWDWSFIPFFPSLGSVVDSSKVRRLCPSISFLFARLGVSLGSSRSFFPLIKCFVFGGNGLGLVLADLLPLLC